jgi:hypothetical protein
MAFTYTIIVNSLQLALKFWLDKAKTAVFTMTKAIAVSLRGKPQSPLVGLIVGLAILLICFLYSPLLSLWEKSMKLRTFSQQLAYLLRFSQQRIARSDAI